MLILDFHILREFNKALIQWLFAFIGILLITEVFEMANTLINMRVPLLVSIEYFIYKIPLTAAWVTPVAVLIATLFSLSGLAKTNEITAMKASGISIYRIILPILLEAAVITLLSFTWQELVVPETSRQAKYIKEAKIN
ncbi:MAG: LptF/LptG family permease, partial [bacterium]|nr:LptF/LptG family permease [bacterium]